MGQNALRYATPTAQGPSGDGSSGEGRDDPHGIQWTRGVPPIDCKSYASTSGQNVVADSTTRGTGGRRASGFQLLAAGTVSIVTGAGQTENFQGSSMPQGFALTVEFTSITTSGAVVVTW